MKRNNDKQPVKIPDFQTRYFYGGTFGS